MTDHYDSLETRSDAERARDLAARLPQLIRVAQTKSPHYAAALKGVEANAIQSPADLAALPVLRKSSLIGLQKNAPPLGGLLTQPLADMGFVFQSPGPIYEAYPRRPDPARFARAMFAAGFRRGELVHNTYSYHFTPAGFMTESSAAALGCPVFAAGGGQTELQVEAIARLKPVCYAGTPSFLNIILEKAAELHVDVSSIRKGLVSAEPLPPSLRASFAARGIRLYQCYGTAELGLVAYETVALQGLTVDEGAIVEIVRPGSGDPVPDGEVGEVVVTVLNTEYPLIRFATGDLSAVLEGPCPTGRTNRRIKGWMGRADQTTKVRGMFVHPEQVTDVIKRHAEIRRARLVVTSDNHHDVMTLHCEVERGAEHLADTIAASVRDICKLRGEVQIVGVGTLPNDGKVIDDQRDFK
ncbi:MAG: phenylacetate--CoA ligase family protein [Burkholderiaceae bacterium]|nr:MAG: phenylacetate--CoA ligase family protein [Burkholderiaceae bacterium]